MRKFNVYDNGTLLTTVEAERLFVRDGFLSFYNVSIRKDVAGFAPGTWSWYAEVKG